MTQKKPRGIPSGEECPFCTGTDLRSFRVYDRKISRFLSIVECRTCCVAWQWPMWNDGTASTREFEEEYSRDDHENTYYHPDRRRAISRMQVDFLARLLPSGGKVLDVGAGMGYFVKAARDRGFDCVGVDPSTAGAERAEQMGHGHVIQGVLADIPEQQTYDAVTMWDVIEHVEDPQGLLMEAARRLRPGGWLVIETGNYQSAARLQLGPEWWLWHHDHRWYLSPGCVEKLLNACGCRSTVRADEELRPDFRRDQVQPPSAWMCFKTAVRKPWKAVSVARQYRTLRQAFKQWPNWVHLSIFTMAGQLQNQEQE